MNTNFTRTHSINSLLVTAVLLFGFVTAYPLFAFGQETNTYNPISLEDLKTYKDKKYTYILEYPDTWKVSKQKIEVPGLSKKVTTNTFYQKDKKALLEVSVDKKKLFDPTLEKETYSEVITVGASTTTSYVYHDPRGITCPEIETFGGCLTVKAQVYHNNYWYLLTARGSYAELSEIYKEIFSTFRFYERVTKQSKQKVISDNQNSIITGRATLTARYVEPFTVEISGTYNDRNICESGAQYVLDFGYGTKKTFISNSCKQQKFSFTETFSPPNRSISLSFYAPSDLNNMTYHVQSAILLYISTSGNIGVSRNDPTTWKKG